MNKEILVVEDDEAIIRLLKLALSTNGYTPILSRSGLEGISTFLGKHPDLVLLDLGLPDIDGMEVLSQIRAVSETPIIIVSARGQESEKVTALDQGADDYVTKPFAVNELLARIRVALRKNNKAKEKVESFHYKGLVFDVEKHKVTLDGEDIHLTPIEFNILHLLIENQGKVLTHNFIEKRVWGSEGEEEHQSLRVYMTGLRRKIEKNSAEPEYIQTEIGIGYRFSDEPVPSKKKR